MKTAESTATQNQIMRRYYRWQSSVYDLSRWTFLHGRRRICWLLPHDEQQALAEIGCGTGFNLKHLAGMHPQWQLTGIDISPDMLQKAARATAPFSNRVTLIERAYGSADYQLPEPVDSILFSYSLTMFNPGWEAAIEQAWKDLKPGGYIAVVDFHNTPFKWFRKWMDHHHVRMDRHLLPLLRQRFHPVIQEIKDTQGHLWQYFLFLGQKEGGTALPGGMITNNQ